MKRCDQMREAATLDEEIKTVSARQMETLEVPLESVGPMLSSKAITLKLSSVPFCKA